MSSEVKGRAVSRRLATPEGPRITKEHGVWVVRVERAGGKQQEYRCATEAQARALEVALSKKDS